MANTNPLSGQPVFAWDDTWEDLDADNNETITEAQQSDPSQQPTQSTQDKSGSLNSTGTGSSSRSSGSGHRLTGHGVSLELCLQFISRRIETYQGYGDLKQFKKRGNYMLKNYRNAEAKTRVLLNANKHLIIKKIEQLDLSWNNTPVMAADITEFIQGTILFKFNIFCDFAALLRLCTLNRKSASRIAKDIEFALH